MKYQEILKHVSKDLGINITTVLATYKWYFSFIREHIKELPLYDDLTEEEFNKLRTDFNVKGLGKFRCTYRKYKGVKKYLNRNKNEEKSIEKD